MSTQAGAASPRLARNSSPDANPSWVIREGEEEPAQGATDRLVIVDDGYYDRGSFHRIPVSEPTGSP
jgi:hypothetical protein